MEAPDAYIEGEQFIVNELEVVKDFGEAASDAQKYNFEAVARTQGTRTCDLPYG